MAFDDYPVSSIVGGLTATVILAVLTSAVANPFAVAALMAASVASSAAVGLGLAGLIADRPNNRQTADTARPSPIAATEQPALSPDPDGPRRQEILFAERVFHEHADAPERGRVH
jgi:hypothetical protein